MLIVTWFLFSAFVAFALLHLYYGNRKAAVPWGIASLGALLVAIGAHFVALWAAAIAAVVLAIFRRWKEGLAMGAIAATIVVVAQYATVPSNTTNDVIAPSTPHSEGTGISEEAASTPVTTADPYLDCIDSGMSKSHCTKVAAAARYKLTADDRKLSDWKPTVTQGAQDTRTISDKDSTRTQSPYKPCFPTRAELEQWLTFSVDATYDDKYDYIQRNDPYTLSPGDKVRIVKSDYAPFQDGQTPIKVYILPDKRMPFPGDAQTCFASDDGVLFANE